MFRSLAISFSLAALVALAPASAEIIQLEDAYELSSSQVSIPRREGSLFVRKCRECQSVRLQLRESTRYFFGEEQVTLKELRREARREDRLIYVFYEPETRVVTRIVLSSS